MIDIFKQFIIVFTGNTLAVEPLAVLLACSVALGLVYVLLKIVCPSYSKLRYVVFVIIWISTCLIILNTYGISLINIVDNISYTGGVV